MQKSKRARALKRVLIVGFILVLPVAYLAYLTAKGRVHLNDKGTIADFAYKDQTGNFFTRTDLLGTLTIVAFCYKTDCNAWNFTLTEFAHWTEKHLVNTKNPLPLKLVAFARTPQTLPKPWTEVVTPSLPAEFLADIKNAEKARLLVVDERAQVVGTYAEDTLSLEDIKKQLSSLATNHFIVKYLTEKVGWNKLR